MANSFKAKGDSPKRDSLESRWINDLLSIRYVWLIKESTAVAKSSLLMLAKNPNLPKLMPKMGMFLSFTSDAIT